MGNPIEIKKAPRVSRRSFFKLSIAAGSAAAFSVLFRETTPNTAAAQPPSPLHKPTPQEEPQNDIRQIIPNYEIPGHYGWHYDYRGVDPAEFEQMGAVGTQLQVGWSEIHRGPHDYNWEPIDRTIQDTVNRDLKVKIVDNHGQERVIYKPIVVSFFMYLSGNPNNPYEFTPYLPDFVREQTGGGVYNIPSPRAECLPQVAPKYDDPVLQRYYIEFVQAFAQRYGNKFFPGTNQPVFAAAEPGPWGIDSEVGNAVKNIRQSGVTCDYVTAFKQILAYQAYLEAFSRAGFDREGSNRDLLDRIVSAFEGTNIPVFINYTSDGKKLARQILDYTPDYPIPLGIRQATAVTDQSNAIIIGTDGTPYGIVDIFDYAKAKGLPTAIETASYRVDSQRKYLTLIAMLATARPELVQLLSSWFEDIKNDPALAREFKYFYRFIGKTPETGPEVWTVLRDTDFPLKYIGSVRYGGFAGDFNWGLERVNVRQDATVVYGDVQETGAWAPRNPALPAPAKDHLWGLRARGNALDSRYMFFRVNPEWGKTHRQSPTFSSYELRLRFVNNDNGTITVNYRNSRTGTIDQKVIQKGSSLGPMNQFVEVTVPLFGAFIGGSLEEGTDFFLDAEEEGTMIIQSLFLKPEFKKRMIFPFIQANHPFPER